ncbi:MAG: hypothetical protein PHN69_01070 [Candidatus Pacebacteria bacterium]|nr:hypothetical protein [Candidatus Paceibacterota bacterium]
MNKKMEGLVEQPIERLQKIEAVYTRPDGKQETIEFDFEKELTNFSDFYKKTGIELPSDFEDSMRDIWNRNQEQIQNEVGNKGFNEILLIPENISLTELKEKMSVGNGYFEHRNFENNGSFDKVISPTKNNRIVLTYNTKELTDRPELNSTLDTKEQDVNISKALSLEDYLILYKKIFEETGEHIDVEKSSWTSTKLDTRLVHVRCFSIENKLDIDADGFGYHDPDMGTRTSSSFK